jgi:hypothetical protein
MNEADVKRAMIKSVKAAGGYARRIEDQYAVGMVDTILIPKGLPVFMAEVKLIQGEKFSPSPRQFVELEQIKDAANEQDHVIPLMVGYKIDTKVFYFHPPQMFIRCTDCFSVTTSDMTFNNQLMQYYFSRRK